MKTSYTKILLMITVLLTVGSSFGQLADVTYTVQVGNILSKEGGILGACYEFGNEEYTAYGGFYDELNTTVVNSPCLQCDFNGNCNYGGGTAIGSRSNNAYVLYYYLTAFEDDGGARCNYNSADDCYYSGSPGGYYFREATYPSNSLVVGGQLNTGSHELRLDWTWKYSGTASFIAPTCASQTMPYFNNAIRSWSTNLTAGRTYRFSTVGLSTEDTYLRIYGPDGVTIVAQNDDASSTLQSTVDYTPGATGTYYVELSRYVSSTNFRGYMLGTGSLLYQDITTPAINPGAIAASTTLCTGGSASLTSTSAASGGFDGNPTLSWESSTNGVNWTVIAGASSATYATPTLTTTTSYRRKATDCKGTTAYSNVVTITIVADPIVSLSSAAPNGNICTGGSSLLTANASGGTGAIVYQWQYNNGTNWISTGTNSSTLTASPSITRDYRVLISTNVSGCNAQATQTITVFSDPTVSISSSNVTCNGLSNGSATSSLTGGTPVNSYNYNWSNGQNTPNATGLAAGVYTLNVNGSYGCSTTGTVTITQPTVLAASSTSGTIACNGGSTTVTVNATGGTAPYTGTGTYTVTAGTYTYTVTDANGCQATTSITVGQPSALTASSTSGSIACNGGSTTVTVNATGGTAPYTGTGTYTVTAGTYTYTVTDANGCQATTSITVGQPSALTASSTSGSIACNGGSTTVTVTGNGGTAPYTGIGTFTVTAGTYSYTVTDANGCSATTSITVSEPTALSASSTSGSIACNGGSTTVTVSGNGGTAPYTGTGTFTVTAGTYSYTVTDANGCQATTQITVTEPSLLTASNVVSDFNGYGVSCNGGNNGSIDVSAAGGVTPYSGTGMNSGLTAGVYSYTVTDANGCTASTSNTITEPSLLTASNVVSDYNGYGVSCNGGNNGSIDVSAAGGVTPYSGTGMNSGLTAGVYSYTVTDANGCTASTSNTITEPSLLTASNVVSDYNGYGVSCNGGSNGEVMVSAAGGTAPYSGTGNNAGLSAGSYSYTVSDANGCTASTSATITEPSVLTVGIVGSDYNSYGVSCYQSTDGSADATANGGVSGYSYSWSNGSTSEDLSGLAAGSYSVTVTDANGCTAGETVVLVEPTKVNISATNTAIACFGGNSTVTVTTWGGALQYQVNDAGTYSVPAGSYTYNVVDANGCSASTDITIGQPTLLVASASTSDYNGYGVSCNGGSNGEVMVTAVGGTVPYSGTGNNAGLSAGSYSYTVTDANGCTSTVSATITEPAALSVALTGSDYNGYGVSCYNSADGSVSSAVTGGVGPFTYTWNNGSSADNIDGLAAGEYSVMVTDANGCVDHDNITLSEPTKVTIAATNTTILCNGDLSTITVTTGGGATPYQVNDANVYYEPAGSYTYNVVDANGCSASTSLTITQPTAIVVNAGPDETVFFGYAPAACAELSATATGGTGSLSLSWTSVNSGGAVGSTILACPSSNEVYTATAVDANGCVATDQVSICVVNVTCKSGNGPLKVEVCHKGHTICISPNAVATHLAHGDQLGACGEAQAACGAPASKDLHDDHADELEASLAAYPNPTDNTTTISVTLTRSGNYSVELYDMMGKLVTTIYAGSFEEYENLEFEVDMSNLNTGVYMVSVMNGDQKIENIRVMKN